MNTKDLTGLLIMLAVVVVGVLAANWVQDQLLAKEG